MEPCPDSAADAERTCWGLHPELKPEIGDNVDVISWLKAEMKDGLEHEYAHAVLGPFIFGFDEDGAPNFHVRRDEHSKKWTVVAKPEWKPAGPEGIIHGL